MRRRVSNPDGVFWEIPPVAHNTVQGYDRPVTGLAAELVGAGLIELKPAIVGGRQRYGLTGAGEATLLDWVELALTGENPSPATDVQREGPR